MTRTQFELMRSHLSPSEKVRLDEHSRQLAWGWISSLLHDVNLKNIQYGHTKQYQIVTAAIEFVGPEYIINGIDKLLMFIVKLIDKKYISMPLSVWDKIIEIDNDFVEWGCYKYGEKI